MMETMTVGITAIDEKHDVFFTMLERLKASSDQEFMGLFSHLIDHTKEHFAFEETLMRDTNFYGFHEHFQEHQTLLEEMEYFYKKAQRLLPFGRSYVNDYAFDKFKRHILNIDSQLAMYLNEIKVL